MACGLSINPISCNQSIVESMPKSSGVVPYIPIISLNGSNGLLMHFFGRSTLRLARPHRTHRYLFFLNETHRYSTRRTRLAKRGEAYAAYQREVPISFPASSTNPAGSLKPLKNRTMGVFFVSSNSTGRLPDGLFDS